MRPLKYVFVFSDKPMEEEKIKEKLKLVSDKEADKSQKKVTSETPEKIKETSEKSTEKSHEKLQSVQHCYICKKQFLNLQGLNSHFEPNHIIRIPNSLKTEFYCYQCKDRFSEEGLMQHHMLVHTQGVENDFKCPFCNLPFTLSSELNGHFKVAHSKTSCTFNQCKKVFESYSNLNLHYQNAHSMNEKDSLKLIERSKKVFKSPEKTKPECIPNKVCGLKENNSDEKNNNLKNEKVLEKTGKKSVKLNSPQFFKNAKKSTEKKFENLHKKKNIKKTEKIPEQDPCKNFSIDFKEFEKIKEKFQNNKKLLPNGYPKVVLKQLTLKQIKAYSVNCSVESQMSEKEIIPKSSGKNKQSGQNLSDICGNNKFKNKEKKKKRNQCETCQKCFFDG